ncbi:MAG TPA: radical SAM protein [Terriglobia bacterium]|nr:radical SAM protein [Terriglobia bacterium]
MKAEPAHASDPRIGQRDRGDLVTSLPVLVIMPHSRCNCRCMMCDIWKIRQVRELTAEDLKPHRDSIRALGVEWVVFSGGEPMLHSHLRDLSSFFRSEGIRVTLLTAGLLLEKRAAMVAESFDDVIASLDGPEEIHDRVRGVPGAFGRLSRGIGALRVQHADFPVHARCTVQKENFNRLRQTVAAARRMNFNSISFLAADLSSAAFNRAEGWPEERRSAVRLDSDEVDELAREMEALICENETDIHERFILENASKLRNVVRHFRVQLGQCSPLSPRCNAPWVSAVIGSDGSLLPCFFHPSIGNIHEKPLVEILNSDRALNFRANLNIATNPTCQRCVCSLYLENPPSAED